MPCASMLPALWAEMQVWVDSTKLTCFRVQAQATRLQKHIDDFLTSLTVIARMGAERGVLAYNVPRPR